MKLIIDLDEEVYQHMMGNDLLQSVHGHICYKAVQNGTPLDKIRAEISELPKKYPMTMDYENGLKEALAIIDKYKGDKE